jgi:hypothetical protein
MAAVPRDLVPPHKIINNNNNNNNNNNTLLDLLNMNFVIRKMFV